MAVARERQGVDGACATGPDSRPDVHRSSFAVDQELPLIGRGRRAWPQAAELEPRPYDALEWDRFPWPEAVTWFARGLGAAHLGRLGDAERLAELEQAAARAGEQLFTRQVLVLRLVVSAWLAHVRGQGRTRARADAGCGGARTLHAQASGHAAPTLPA